MKFLYLAIDLLAIAVPLIFSFHPRIEFYKSWNALSKAIGLVSLLFLIFDSIFTSYGVWGFNPTYITGVYLFNLPLEEVLFFICIPYSCVFTYYCLTKFYNLSWNQKTENIFCILFSLILLVTGLAFHKKLYTSSTFISTALLCMSLKFAGHIKWFGKSVSVFGILLFPFLIVNGILTGTGLSAPIVRYNPLYNLGIRVMTIPIEDIVYGFELFLFTLALFLRFNKQPALINIPYNRPTITDRENFNKNGKYSSEQNQKPL